MTEEELALRLKSAFPAVLPAGDALHARVEGKERDARRGIGRKRRGRAIFATIGAAYVLTPVALRIPVMYIFYRFHHQLGAQTTYSETFDNGKFPPRSKSWHSGNNRRMEFWEEVEDGRDKKYILKRLKIVKDKKIFEWWNKSIDKPRNTKQISVENISPIGILSIPWIKDAWDRPFWRVGKDKIINGVSCKEIFVEDYTNISWYGFFMGERSQLLSKTINYIDMKTGRQVRMELWSVQKEGLQIDMVYQAHFDVPVPDSLFDAPHDPNLVSVKPF
jgi:hypothetical protein